MSGHNRLPKRADSRVQESVSRMTRLADNPIGVLSLGQFGNRVAAYLKKLRSDCVEIHNDFGCAQDSLRIRIYVLASWRAASRECTRLNNASYRNGIPFIPLIVNGRSMSVGPIVVPGQGACWECWIQRVKQHDPYAAMHSAIEDRYASDDDSGPAGFLEPVAYLGAVFISQAVDRLDGGDRSGGCVLRVDMLSREVSHSRVVQVHGCQFCGLRERNGIYELQRTVESILL